MSLVNDLLIELDRQNEEEGHAPSAFMRDLKPRDRDRKSVARRIAYGLALAACLLFVGLGVSQIATIPGDEPAAALAPVAARPIASPPPPATPEAIPAPAPIPQIVERPPAIRSVSLERRARSTRVRIEGDRSLVHRLHQAPSGRSLELVFEGATLTRDLGALDLVDTPIRSVAVEPGAGALSLRLDLDAGTRVQSQFLDAASGTTIFLDLHAAPESAVVERSAAAPTSPAPPPDRLEPETRPGAAVAIGPSIEELARREKIAARQAAREALAKARAAAKQGDDARANQLYRAAVELGPTDRDALVEWAALLARSGQPDQAVELTQRALRKAPNDVRLTMLHARLLDDAGEAEEAIAVLDRSRATLTQAPELHALAAALLQRAGRHPEAIERYDAIVRRYPDDARNWLGLAISLDAESRSAEALDVYRIAMQIGTLSRPSRAWVTSRIEALDTDEEG